MNYEIIDGTRHPDPRDTRTKVFDAAWEVPRRTVELPHQSELDALAAKMAKDAWEKEYNDPATPFDRKEQMRLQELQDNYLDRIESEKAIAEHLKQPRIARKLAEAKAIRSTIVADPERTVADIQNADRVIATYSEPDGDFDIADAALRQLKESENNYRLDKASEIRKQRAELDRKFGQLVSGLHDTSNPDRIRVEGNDVYSRIDSLANLMADTPGYSLDDLAEVQAARRNAVLLHETDLAEQALAKYADTSPEIDRSGLEVQENGDE